AVDALGTHVPGPAEPEAVTEWPPAVGRPGGEFAVDEIGEALGGLGENLLLLRLGQAAVRDGLVELLLQVVLERGDEAVDRLALVLRDLRERLAGLELRPELALAQAEVLGGCGPGRAV